MAKMKRNESKPTHLANLLGNLLLILFISTGCAPATETIPKINPTVTIEPQETSSLTETQTKVVLPTRTIASTLAITETPLATWTSLPTLTNKEANLRMTDWLQGSQDCLLPCWAGITPKKTTWQEAKQVLGTVVNFIRTDEGGTCKNNICDLIEWRSRNGADVHGYTGSQADGSVSLIMVELGNPAFFYRMDQLLTQYGPPAKAFIFTNTFLAPTSSLSLELTLAYPNHDFINTYAMDAKKSGENVITCNQESSSLGLFIEPIDGIWSDDLIKSEVYSGTDLSSVNFIPLEQVTDITIGQFYERFKS